MRLRSSRVVETVFDIDFDALRAQGVRVLLFDLDKTLGPRRAEGLPVRSLRLLESLTARGFHVGILSNRRRPRHDAMIEDLAGRFDLLHSAGKPRRRGYLALLERFAAAPSETAMIGDKWITDILGANRLGMVSVRVRDFPRGSC
jgi:HAD superfamily phosphatase (TIGR01668 family)